MRCPVCGKECQDEFKYCDSCGYKFEKSKGSRKTIIVLAILIVVGLGTFVLKEFRMSNDAPEHSYEYIVSDISWSQAQEDAVKKGGYLVNINSKEEFERIISEIRENGLEDILFRIGGRRNGSDSTYYWVDEENQQIGGVLNADDSWCQDLWASGEPSLEYKNFRETCMDMYQSDGTWLWNDVPDNMIEAVSDTYIGRLGYIIEYGEPGHSNE